MIEQTVLSGFCVGGWAFVMIAWSPGQGVSETGARSLVMLMMVLFENVHVFNRRSEYLSVFKVPLSANPLVGPAVAVMLVLLVVVTYTPEVGQFLGIGVANLINVLGLDAVIIGGGLIGGWDMFIEELSKEAHKRAFRLLSTDVKILKSALTTDGGSVGAAGLLFNEIAGISRQSAS